MSNAEAAQKINHTSASSNRSNKPCVLAVDDSRTMLMMLTTRLEELGYAVMKASDGKEAWEKVKKHREQIDVLLLDREMPEMNGLEVVAFMKNDPAFNNIPIIMQTGSDRPEQIKEGIDAGVYYYLTKPIEEHVLESVLSAAVREARQQQTLGSELEQHKASFNLIDSCAFTFHLLPEAESLACFIANCFPEPNRVVSGLAELLINAVEHGNLEVGYDGKTHLVRANSWREELIRRAGLPEHKDKKIRVTFKRNKEGVYVKIVDEGNGFDWRKYMQIDPARAQDNHGRGIAQANAISFDRVDYNDVGNEVTAYVNNEPELDW